MKRCIFVVLALLLLSSCLTAYAATLPAFEVRDGNTYLGVFYVSDAPSDQLEFWKEWKESSNNYLLCGPAGICYFFIIAPEGSTCRLSGMSGEHLQFTCTEAVRYLRFDDDPSDPRIIRPVEIGSIAPGAFAYDAMYYISGTGEVTAYPGSISYDYLIDPPEGALILEDDLTGENDPGFWGQIWDWLSSFWEKLLNLLKSLFIPSDDYLSSWVEEIRNAFNAKVGGLTSFFDTLKSRFDSLKNGSYAKSGIIFTVPDSLLFPGYKGVSVDLLGGLSYILSWLRKVLNGILTVLTVIICYRKLLAIIKT